MQNTDQSNIINAGSSGFAAGNSLMTGITSRTGAMQGRPIAANRFIDNNLSQALSRYYSYQVHINKLNKIKNDVDASKNKKEQTQREMMGFILRHNNNRNKAQEFSKNENKIRVKRDNQILLSKLLDISAGKNKSVPSHCVPSRHSLPNHTKSLHGNRMKKEQTKIYEENQLISGSRQHSTPSKYSYKSQHNSFNQSLKLRKFPASSNKPKRQPHKFLSNPQNGSPFKQNVLEQSEQILNRRSFTSHKARNLMKYAMVQQAEIQKLQQEIEGMVKQGNLGFAPPQANFPEGGTDRHYLQEQEESKDAMNMLQNQKFKDQNQNKVVQNVNKKALDGIKYQPPIELLDDSSIEQYSKDEADNIQEQQQQQQEQRHQVNKFRKQNKQQNEEDVKDQNVKFPQLQGSQDEDDLLNSQLLQRKTSIAKNEESQKVLLDEKSANKQHSSEASASVVHQKQNGDLTLGKNSQHNINDNKMRQKTPSSQHQVEEDQYTPVVVDDDDNDNDKEQQNNDDQRQDVPSNHEQTGQNVIGQLVNEVQKEIQIENKEISKDDLDDYSIDEFLPQSSRLNNTDEKENKVQKQEVVQEEDDDQQYPEDF